LNRTAPMLGQTLVLTSRRNFNFIQQKMKFLMINPLQNHHFGHKLVRQLNIDFHASNVLAINYGENPFKDRELSLGCSTRFYERHSDRDHSIQSYFANTQIKGNNVVNVVYLDYDMRRPKAPADSHESTDQLIEERLKEERERLVAALTLLDEMEGLQGDLNFYLPLPNLYFEKRARSPVKNTYLHQLVTELESALCEERESRSGMRIKCIRYPSVVNAKSNDQVAPPFFCQPFDFLSFTMMRSFIHEKTFCPLDSN